MNAPTPHDPKGLIRESFRIAGITAAECRSIFLDWALSLPAGADARAPVTALLAQYRPTVPPDHPMLSVLEAALAAPARPRRRGGRQGRGAAGVGTPD